MKTIFQVNSVRITPAEDGKYTVEAHGTVSTAGWTNPAIIGAGIINDDGGLRYDFEAQPPSGQALQVLTSVVARSQFGGPGTSLKGLKRVIVTARNGEVSAAFPPVC